MNPIHFLRMSRWARHPPSRRRVILVLGVLAACLILFGLERLFGLPEWMQIENLRQLRTR